MKDIKNVFISHYGKDDEHIGNLKNLMGEKGYQLRNSSIDSTKPNQASNEEYIKSLLRERIKWASSTIVLIGPKTHTRPWVDWEIEQSFKQGNNIVGVFINGASDSDIPESFTKYGNALLGWRSEKIIAALEGDCTNFDGSDGEPWNNPWSSERGVC